MESEAGMQRLISLFREPEEPYGPAKPDPRPADDREPLYFQELLKYLRERRSEQPKNDESKLVKN